MAELGMGRLTLAEIAFKRTVLLAGQFRASLSPRDWYDAPRMQAPAALGRFFIVRSPGGKSGQNNSKPGKDGL
jgi:hypothetical protein